MEPTSYDNFRWLDDDDDDDDDIDLDLALDEHHHAHVANAAAADISKIRRLPSIRRSLPFPTHSLMKYQPSLSLQMPTQPPLSGNAVQPICRPAPSHCPISSPASRLHQLPLRHAPNSSTLSIERAALYYQGPDPRLELRVNLALPQHFVESVEFLFPLLNLDKANIPPDNEPNSSKPSPMARDCAGTFFEDNDGTVVGSSGGSGWPRGSIGQNASPTTSSQQRKLSRPSIATPSLLQRRQSLITGSKTGPQWLPDNREVALRITLLGLNLRTESSTSFPTFPKADPLRMATLHRIGRNHINWDLDTNGRGAVKKTWRRLCRRV